MGNHDTIVDFPEMRNTQCPACGKDSLASRIEETPFVYGTGASAANLTCPVPVHTCAACGFEFTDDKAEDARDLAVRRYLHVMTPDQIRAIRESYRLSRRDFGAITRIGEASLARWESGEIIQNAGYDQYLYLLTFPENFERLREHQENPTKRSNESDSESKMQSRFPSIRNVRQTAIIAREWQLRKIS